MADLYEKINRNCAEEHLSAEGPTDGMCVAAEHPNAAAHRQVEHNMTNHAPRDHHVILSFERLRLLAKEFAHEVVELCPDSRERSLALTHAEQALMWAVAGVARNQR